MEVTLNKEPGVGLGIGACCLTLENSAPGIYIHSLAPGSVAKMDGRLSRGDQVLEVDSVSLRHAALSEAYAILSECGPGPVSLIISRHPNPKVSEQEMDRVIARSTHRDNLSKDGHSSHTLGLPSKSPSPTVRAKLGEGSPGLSWTMKRFLEPASRQGSLSSETELSQYFSQDITSHSSLSESMLMDSTSDDMFHIRSCSTSMDDPSSQPHGVEGGVVYHATQGKTSGPVNHHVEAACQPSVSPSPTSVRSPLLRQRQVMCYEDDTSNDDEDPDDAENASTFCRPTNSRAIASSDGQASQLPENDSGIVIATSSLEVDEDSQDGRDLQRDRSSDVATVLYSSSLESEEGNILNSGSESPFMPIHFPLNHEAGVAASKTSGSSNLVIKKDMSRDGGQMESKRSPKLEHKAVTRVKSMMSIEAPNLPQQAKPKGDEPSSALTSLQQPSQALQGGGISSRTSGWSIPHHNCRKGEMSELAGVCTIDTVTLRRSEEESFGLDLEIKSSPVKVVITGLRPGGAAERESMGKLSIGDEIVAIGEKPVCSSSYQEICEFMHNLPLTLSLEVKRPVSAVDRLSSLIMSSMVYDEATSMDPPISAPEAADERKISVNTGNSLPQKSYHSTTQTNHDSQIPVTNIDDFILDQSVCSDKYKPSHSPSKALSNETVPCCSSVSLLEKGGVPVQTWPSALDFSILNTGNNKGCLMSLGKTFLNSYSRNLSNLNNDSSDFSSGSNKERPDTTSKFIYDMVDDRNSESESNTGNNHIVDKMASSGENLQEPHSDEEEVEICFREPQQHATQSQSQPNQSLNGPLPPLHSSSQSAKMAQTFDVLQHATGVSAENKNHPVVTTQRPQLSQLSGAYLIGEPKAISGQEQCQSSKDTIHVPFTESTECRISSANGPCDTVDTSVACLKVYSSPFPVVDTYSVTPQSQDRTANVHSNASQTSDTVKELSTQIPPHSTSVESKASNPSNSGSDTRVSASLTVRDKEREKVLLSRTISSTPNSPLLRTSSPKFLSDSDSSVLSSNLKLQYKSQDRTSTSAAKLKGLSIKSKNKPQEQLSLKPATTESPVPRTVSASPIQSPKPPAKKAAMYNCLKTNKQLDMNSSLASPKLSETRQDRTKSQPQAETSEAGQSANKKKEVSSGQGEQGSQAVTVPQGQQDTPPTQRSFIEVQLSSTSSSSSKPVQTCKETVNTKDSNPVQRLFSQNDINRSVGPRLEPMPLPSSSTLELEKTNTMTSNKVVNSAFSKNETHSSTSNGSKICTTEPGESPKSSRSTLYIRTMEKHRLSMDTVLPGDPNPFSVRQKIKSFENLASFDKPVVKCIDIQSYALTCRPPLNQRLSGYVGLVNSIDCRALRRSFSSCVENLNPIASLSPLHGKSPSSITLINFDLPPAGCDTLTKDKVVSEVPKVSDGIAPQTSPVLRNKHARGNAKLSRTRLRELRALSMPDLEKLCTEDFSSGTGTVTYKTDQGIHPVVESPVTERCPQSETPTGLDVDRVSQGDPVASEDSPQEGPGTHGQQPGWSISLKELAFSPVNQSKLQAILSTLTTKSDVLALLQEAKALSEVNDNTHFVVLTKEEGSGLGFSIAGGVDLEQKSVTVHRVFTKGVASLEGSIQRGDSILCINGTNLEGKTHGEALSCLHQARLSTQAVVVIRRGKDSDLSVSDRNDVTSQPRSVFSAKKCVEPGAVVNVGPDGALTVVLHKTSAGLGFSLEGGKASAHGDRPLNIKRIFKGGAAELSRVIDVGDEVLAINERSLEGLMHCDAWNIIKAANEGPVHLLIRKPRTSV